MRVLCCGWDEQYNHSLIWILVLDNRTHAWSLEFENLEEEKNFKMQLAIALMEHSRREDFAKSVGKNDKDWVVAGQESSAMEDETGGAAQKEEDQPMKDFEYAPTPYKPSRFSIEETRAGSGSLGRKPAAPAKEEEVLHPHHSLVWQTKKSSTFACWLCMCRVKRRRRIRRRRRRSRHPKPKPRFVSAARSSAANQRPHSTRRPATATAIWRLVWRRIAPLSCVGLRSVTWIVRRLWLCFELNIGCVMWCDVVWRWRWLVRRSVCSSTTTTISWSM